MLSCDENAFGRGVLTGDRHYFVRGCLSSAKNRTDVGFAHLLFPWIWESSEIADQRHEDMPRRELRHSLKERLTSYFVFGWDKSQMQTMSLQSQSTESGKSISTRIREGSFSGTA